MPCLEALFPAPLRAWTRQVVDRPRIVRQATSSAMAASLGRGVYVLEDFQDRHWFLKLEPRRNARQAEVRAYRQWAPSLQGRTATLAGADPDLGTLLVSAVPGRRPSAAAPAAHRQAGRLLRRLHDARPARPRAPGFAGGAELARWREQEPEVLTAEQHEFAMSRARRLNEDPEPVNVPNHGDFRAHDWLVDDDGVLRVIDFGNTKWAPPAADLATLAYGPWWNSPPRSPRLRRGLRRRGVRGAEGLPRPAASHAYRAAGLPRPSAGPAGQGGPRSTPLAAADGPARSVTGRVRESRQGPLLDRSGEADHRDG